MSMSKKDFIGLADVLRRWTARDVSKDVILDIADFLESSNPMFKRERWLDYVQGKCGSDGGARKLPAVPKDWPVQPLKPGQYVQDRVTCGDCGRSWDDGKVTSMTPAPLARCPFESFHAEGGR